MKNTQTSPPRAPSPEPRADLRSSLVTTETVAATLGLDNEAVIARADSDYQYVWDVSVLGSQGKVRELRFWAREVIAPDSVGTLSKMEVLRLILGSKHHFQPGEVGRLLRISAPTRLELEKKGDLVRPAGEKFYPRSSLLTFLISRLIHQTPSRN